MNGSQVSATGYQSLATGSQPVATSSLPIATGNQALSSCSQPLATETQEATKFTQPANGDDDYDDQELLSAVDSFLWMMTLQIISLNIKYRSGDFV